MKKVSKILSVSLVSLSLGGLVIPTINNDQFNLSTSVVAHADQSNYDSPQFAAKVLYYGQNVLNNKTAYGAVIQTLDSGLNNNSLALVKYNSTTTDDLITHLTDKGNYLYVIYTDTNTDIPVYTVKNKIVYMYSVSDAAGQSQDSMFKPIASISIKKLNRTVNDNYLKQYTPKIKLLDATNMNQDDVNNQIDQITMGSNNN